jgi:uncharacterized protein (UPF0333 family)
MAKLRTGSSRPLTNLSKPASADLTEYLLLAALIVLVVGAVVAYLAHRWVP